MSENTQDAELQEKIQNLQQKILKLNLTGKELNQIPSLHMLNSYSRKRMWETLRNSGKVFGVMLGILTLPCLIVWLDVPFLSAILVDLWMAFCYGDTFSDVCLVESGFWVVTLARPPVSCEFCQGLTEVPRVHNISSTEFQQEYAYSSKPVLIEKALEGWTATETFSFSFFKSLYSDNSYGYHGNFMCQFFPYRTSFESLSEVFSMSEERANLTEGTEPWYIGWSNCDSSVANILREHYQRPYFLPSDAEATKTDWIFMGTPGYGAHMHIDAVLRSSWQAQVTGSKMWILEPPPECYFQCAPQLRVTMNPGDVIVVDTNNWYHATEILGKNLSITIGSEYN